MKSLSIGEIARRTGLRTSALRYYEEAEILPAVTRINGRRRYDLNMIRRIEILRFAQQAGFTLQEIKTLLHGGDRDATLSARWRALARAKLEEVDALVAKAARMRRGVEIGLQCGCVRLEECTLSATNCAIRRFETRGGRSVRKTRS
jgi:MerR family redox-sensitive transcriptional activator SoxR